MGMVTIMSQSLITEDEKKFFDENVRESLDEYLITRDGELHLTADCILMLSRFSEQSGVLLPYERLSKLFEYYRETSSVYVMECM